MADSQLINTLLLEVRRTGHHVCKHQLKVRQLRQQVLNTARALPVMLIWLVLLNAAIINVADSHYIRPIGQTAV